MANYPMFLFDLRCSGSAGYLVTTYSWHSYWWIPPVSSEPSGPCQVWLQNNEDFSDSLLPSRASWVATDSTTRHSTPTECDHGNIPATKHRRFSSNWKLGNNGSDFSNIICDLKCYSPSNFDFGGSTPLKMVSKSIAIYISWEQILQLKMFMDEHIITIKTLALSRNKITS